MGAAQAAPTARDTPLAANYWPATAGAPMRVATVRGRLVAKEVTMSTHALPGLRAREQRLAAHPRAAHWLWLGGGLALGFLVPFVFADTLELNRDLYYGVYAAAVIGYVGAWMAMTRPAVGRLMSRRLGLAVALGLVAAAILVLVVYGKDSTARPEGMELAAAVFWRGIVYGTIDGLLLSVFPILAVFSAFAGTRLRATSRGTAVVALVALFASLLMTGVYHAGYSDFRSAKLRQPVAGDIVWSAPTLLTLNPVGAPIAHAAMHTAAVVHSYETDTFLPPHPDG